MLHDFLTRERNTILGVAKQKAHDSKWSRMSSGSVEEGWGIFYDELTGLLTPAAIKSDDKGAVSPVAMGEKQSKQYTHLGYAISEVVQSYTIIYQAITESAANLHYEISPPELQQLNLSLDTAIAEVVAGFEKEQTEAQDLKEIERLGFLAHELRNSLQSATIALELIEGGTVRLDSKTGGVLQNSLQRMAELIDTALAEVRLRSEPDIHRRKIRTFEIMSEVGVTAGFQARSRNLILRMQGSSELVVLADRHLLISALANLVQNALKFTPSGGTVQVRTREEGNHILIEVEDECGGLPIGKIEELFETGVQKGADRTGLGLGLAISRQAIERNKGTLRAENFPGKGCKFIIDLPKPDAK
jgi:signal transduction histidine kinase